MRVTLVGATQMTSKRIRVKNPDNNDEIFYYSYLRTTAVAPSTRNLLNQTVPLFVPGRRTGGYLPSTPAAGGYVALALQNDNLTTVTVSLDLLSADGELLGHSVATLPSGTRYVHALSEIFGITPPAGSGVTVTAATGIQMLGLAADDSTSAVAPINLGDPPAAQLLAVPATLTFHYSAGDPEAAFQTVAFTSSGGGALTFSCSVTPQSQWLSVTPGNGTTPATMNALVNASGLAVGTYQGSITCTPSGATPATVAVTLVVTGPGPQLNADPSSLSFSAVTGGAPPLPRNVTVVSSGSPVTPVITAGAPWLSVAANSNTTPLSLTVAVSTAGLSVGPYTSSIAVTSGSGTLVIPVSLSVTAVPAQTAATLTAPATDTLLSATATFTWTNTGAAKYRLDIGRSPGATNLFTAETTGTSMIVNGLPRDGSTIFVQLSTFYSAYLAPVTATYRVAGALAGGARFVPVAPCRVADTRNAAGPFGGPIMDGGSTRDFPVASAPCGVPAGAQAYSLNITVLPAGPLSFLTAWPAGQARPAVSTLNSFDGSVTSNASIVPAANGSISIFVTDRTDVLIDINGYFTGSAPPEALVLYPVVPCRVADTRLPTGPYGGPSMTAGSTRDFAIAGSGCGIPGTARAYSLNMTVVPAGPLSFLTTFPSGQPRPNVSTLNSFDGSVKANAAIVPAGSGGPISVFVTDRTDVVIDINGYFAPPGAGGLSFYAITPCRAADTRNTAGVFGGPAMTGGSSREFAIPASGCGPMPGVQAYSMNVTVAPASPLAFLTAWPTGAPRPLVSTLNSFAGRVVANAALVPAGTSGAASFFVTDPTHLILDLTGYFAP
jgi:hypothetical protein